MTEEEKLTLLQERLETQARRERQWRIFENWILCVASAGLGYCLAMWQEWHDWLAQLGAHLNGGQDAWPT